MCQKFIARERFDFPNGAIGWAPGGPSDCLGPYAKVENCPIAGTRKRLTAYARDYPDAHWTIPACTRINGKYVKGSFELAYGAIVFYPDGIAAKEESND